MTYTLQMGSAQAQLHPGQPRILIGRDTSCGLVGTDGTLSRRHAEVFLDGGVPYIRDLGSANGTWVDGQPLGPQPVPLRANSQVSVGHSPLIVSGSFDGQHGATVAGALTPEFLAQVEAHRQRLMVAAATPWSPPGPPMAPSAVMPQALPPPQMMAQGSMQMPAMGQPMAPPPMLPGMSGPMPAMSGQMPGMSGPMPAMPQPIVPGMSGSMGAQSMPEPGRVLGVGGSAAPMPAELAYRRQGANGNGSLLIALRGDTFANGQVIDGFVEFTALDSESVASIFVELVEYHRKGPAAGHVWDRMIVRQGPWKSHKGDVLPLPFQLRIPPGTSMSGPSCWWEVRGYVDINWAIDIEAKSPINMRNVDVERIRDALGALDYRVASLEPQALGQRFVGKFFPPAQLKSQLGIADINVEIEYLGTNLQVKIEVEKTALFKRDRRLTTTFELVRLRQAPLTDITAHFRGQIDQMMSG